MKKTRIFSFLLAVLMLGGTAVLFCSCGGTQDGPVTLSGDVVDVDLTGYTVVFADTLAQTETMLDHAKYLTACINKATGCKLVGGTQSQTASSKEDPEILVGLTDRSQSAKAQNAIDGDGFAVEVRDNKIVIVGTTNMHLLMAMEYFREKYLTQPSGTHISVQESARAEEMASVVLDDAAAEQIFMLYEDGMTVERVSGNTYPSGGRDLPGKVIDDLRECFCKELDITQRKRKDIVFPKRSDAEEKTGVEFSVGRVARPFVSECLPRLSQTEYGLFVSEGELAFTAYNDAALKDGAEELIDLFADAVVTREGKKQILFPAGFSLIRTIDQKWVTDFPKPEGEGILLTNTQDNGCDSLQYYYTGAGVGAESYRAYCKTLTDAGYTVLTQNEIEQSLYTTLVSPDKTFSLYVAYNAYAHADEYAYDGAHGAKYEKCFRVISSPLSGVTLPDAGLLTPNPKYDRKTVSAITAMEILGSAVGMGYVITLEDGRFIVFDGGAVANGEHRDLWRLLSATNARITGAPTSSANPVRIAAWVNTHSHWDHYGAFLNMLRDYGPTGELRMDYLLGNFPPETAIYKQANADILAMSKNGAFSSYSALVQGGFQFIKVHAGQKFYLANAEIEVLTTFEDLNPARIYTQNDTNTVLRFTMHTTNEQGVRVGEPVTSVWLGDSNALQSRFMCAMFGDYLKSDMVQLAHHGNVGCEKDLYTCVSAKVLWFPMDYWRFELFTFSGKHPTIQAVNRHALSLPSMQYVYVSSNPGEIGNDYNVCLPFSAETGQPDYDAIYEGVSGESLSYDNVSAFNSTEKFK